MRFQPWAILLGKNGIRMDPDKVSIIANWAIPRTKKEIQSFVGTVVYVSKYCKNANQDIAILTDLMKDKKKNDEKIPSQNIKYEKISPSSK